MTKEIKPMDKDIVKIFYKNCLAIVCGPQMSKYEGEDISMHTVDKEMIEELSNLCKQKEKDAYVAGVHSEYKNSKQRSRETLREFITYNIPKLHGTILNSSVTLEQTLTIKDLIDNGEQYLSEKEPKL